MLMIAKTASTFGAETILDAADRAGRRSDSGTSLSGLTEFPVTGG